MVVVSHLTRAFGPRIAVEDLSFEIHDGEVFVLLGPNGAGKTTTMRMLAGLIAPTAGSIQIGSTNLTSAMSPLVRSRIGLLTETPGLWDRLTARENLVVYARLHRLPDPEAAADRALATFGLADRRNDRAAAFSKGMKQKLAIARTLLHDPSIVLLDEPTAGLDPEIARSVRDIIVDLRSRGRAVLVSTHNLDEAERIADRVAVLRTRLIALDAPEALRRRLFGRRVRIDLSAPDPDLVDAAASAGGRDVTIEGRSLVMSVDDPDTRVPEIVSALVRAGAGIRAVREERPPLEEIYLRLTQADS